MNNTWNDIVQACIPIICLIITAGGAYIVALMKRETMKIEQQLDNEIASKYIEMANECVAQAVLYTSQVFVDSLKTNGAFNKEKQKEAFEMSKQKFLEIMSDTAIEALNEIYGDLDIWLETKIEQVCRETKLEVVEQ